MKQKDGRNRSSSGQAVIREQVVDYLKNKKGTQKQASDIFGLSQSGVEKIWRKYREGGKRAIHEKKRGVKEGKKLKAKQAAEIRRLVRDKLPEQLKLPYGLWTREAVQQLMEARYGVALSLSQVGRYLNDWGYTPQKPMAKAFEQKPEKVQNG